MEKIGTILQKSIRKKNFAKKLLEARIFVEYDLMVGEKISEISRPTFFRNGTLFVGVENHIWLHQLFFLKRDIIESINSRMPWPIVKDVKFQISRIDKKHRNDCDKKEIKQDIPEKTLKTIFEVSQKIEDKELRNAFIRLMIKDAEYKMKKEENNCLYT